MDDVNDGISCVYLRCDTADKEVYSAVREVKLSNRTGLCVGDWFGVEPFISICGIVHVGRETRDFFAE